MSSTCDRFGITQTLPERGPLLTVMKTQLEDLVISTDTALGIPSWGSMISLNYQ